MAGAAPVAHRGEILHFLDDPGRPVEGGRGRDAAWEHFPAGALVVDAGRMAACGERIQPRVLPGVELVQGGGLFDLRRADEHGARVGLGSDVGAATVFRCCAR